MAASLYRTKKAGEASNGGIKDVDTVKGIITGYGASFNTVDSDNQMFIPGCFKKSLSENKDRLRFLYQHCTSMPLGLFTSVEEDKTGLLFVSNPISETTYGKDAIVLYADGVFKEHSVGFEQLASKAMDEGGEDIEGITEARLWEISPVTWGANANTPTVNVKGLFDTRGEEYILERIRTFQKSLHRGSLRDETYILLEIELKQWESILAQGPGEKPTPAAVDFASILEEVNKTQKIFN